MNEMIPFEVKFLHQTESALLVDIEGEKVWLPKSIIEVDEYELDGIRKGNILEISIPEWLATDKQLI